MNTIPDEQRGPVLENGFLDQTDPAGSQPEEEEKLPTHMCVTKWGIISHLMSENQIRIGCGGS